MTTPPPPTPAPTPVTPTQPGPPRSTLSSPLRAHMKRLFVLNLRLDQKRRLVQHHMQQHQHMDVFHGPPYDRVQHWNRCLARVDKEYDDLRKESEGWYGDIEEGAERREEGRRSGLQGERGRCSGSYWGREAMEENLDMDRDMYVEDRHGLSAFVCSVEKLADEMEGLIWEIDGIEE